MQCFKPEALAAVYFFELPIGFHSLVIARNNDSADANDPREEETSWDAEWRRLTRHPAGTHHALFRRYCNFYKLPRCCAGVCPKQRHKKVKKNILPSRFWFKDFDSCIFCKHCPRPLVPDKCEGCFFHFLKPEPGSILLQIDRISRFFEPLKFEQLFDPMVDSLIIIIHLRARARTWMRWCWAVGTCA